jgi:hypothetical protein
MAGLHRRQAWWTLRMFVEQFRFAVVPTPPPPPPVPTLVFVFGCRCNREYDGGSPVRKNSPVVQTIFFLLKRPHCTVHRRQPQFTCIHELTVHKPPN